MTDPKRGLPVVAGMYWWRGVVGESKQDVLLEVYPTDPSQRGDDGPALAVLHPEGQNVYVDQMAGEWRGPLLSPFGGA